MNIIALTIDLHLASVSHEKSEFLNKRTPSLNTIVSLWIWMKAVKMKYEEHAKEGKDKVPYKFI